MFGFVSKRKADELAVGWMRLQRAVDQRAIDQAVADLKKALDEKKKEIQAEREALTARAEAAEARCKALERRLDGWVPADQASSMRWRIAELESQVDEIRAAAGVYKRERDDLRERLDAIAREDDAKAVAFFRPGLPVGFEPVGEPGDRIPDEIPVGGRVVG